MGKRKSSRDRKFLKGSKDKREFHKCVICEKALRSENKSGLCSACSHREKSYTYRIYKK